MKEISVSSLYSVVFVVNQEIAHAHECGTDDWMHPVSLMRMSLFPRLNTMTCVNVKETLY